MNPAAVLVDILEHGPVLALVSLVLALLLGAALDRMTIVVAGLVIAVLFLLSTFLIGVTP